MASPSLPFIKPAIKQILLKAEHYKWSLQGLGMLRLYLNKETRLHIWSKSHQVPNVSTLHTHPWHFSSLVVAGTLTNTRYYPHQEGMPWHMQKLFCGEGGGLVGTQEDVKLWHGLPERYDEGRQYMQKAHEIHQTEAEDFTVTIIERKFNADEDHAFVYWPIGQSWVSAIPRPATPEEVEFITKGALGKWFA